MCKCLERLMGVFLWEAVDEGKGEGAHMVR